MDIIVDRQRFHSRIDSRTNTIAVSSIHPYDETEYHWARQGNTGKNWVIYRNGRQVRIIDRPMTEEQIARELLKLDKAARLTRTGGIW